MGGIARGRVGSGACGCSSCGRHRTGFLLQHEADQKTVASVAVNHRTEFRLERRPLTVEHYAAAYLRHSGRQSGHNLSVSLNVPARHIDEFWICQRHCVDGIGIILRQRESACKMRKHGVCPHLTCRQVEELLRSGIRSMHEQEHQKEYTVKRSVHAYHTL